MRLRLTQLQAGTELPERHKRIAQENIKLYAEASRDFNPIHIDEGFARRTPAGGTIAHGMLILAYLSQAMTDFFGKHWLSGGKLSIRFKAPARPGDLIKICGKVSKVEKAADHYSVFCDVLCQNQRGEAVITGEARVRAQGDEDID
jgi:3-hydroxybutyryl-CoA dehydratase